MLSKKAQFEPSRAFDDRGVAALFGQSQDVAGVAAIAHEPRDIDTMPGSLAQMIGNHSGAHNRYKVSIGVARQTSKVVLVRVHAGP